MNKPLKIAAPSPETIGPAADVFRELENRLTWNDRPDTRPASAGGLIASPERVLAFELRNYLHAIFSGRTRHGLAIGPLDGWARCIAHVAAGIEGKITQATIRKHAGWIGVSIPDAILRTTASEMGAALSAGALDRSPAVLGEAVQLTAAEREDYGIRRLIDACDETAEDRRKRLNRERQARRRQESGATPRSQSLKVAKPWDQLRISERTYYRRYGGRKTSRTPIDSIQKKSARDEKLPNAGARDEKLPRHEVEK